MPKYKLEEGTIRLASRQRAGAKERTIEANFTRYEVQVAIQRWDWIEGFPIEVRERLLFVYWLVCSGRLSEDGPTQAKEVSHAR